MIYSFESNQFALSETGFHFLRSRFNYKTLNYSEIDKVEFKRWYSIKNWLVILILGVFSVSIAILWSVNIFFFFEEGIGTIYIEELVAPLILLIFGLFFIYKSFHKTNTIHIYFDGKHDFFNLENINNQKDLIDFMILKVGSVKVFQQLGNK